MKHDCVSLLPFPLYHGFQREERSQFRWPWDSSTRIGLPAGGRDHEPDDLTGELFRERDGPFARPLLRAGATPTSETGWGGTRANHALPSASVASAR